MEGFSIVAKLSEKIQHRPFRSTEGVRRFAWASMLNAGVFWDRGYHTGMPQVLGGVPVLEGGGGPRPADRGPRGNRVRAKGSASGGTSGGDPAGDI